MERTFDFEGVKHVSKSLKSLQHILAALFPPVDELAHGGNLLAPGPILSSMRQVQMSFIRMLSKGASNSG
jgi:hypothetical protein